MVVVVEVVVMVVVVATIVIDYDSGSDCGGEGSDDSCDNPFVGVVMEVMVMVMVKGKKCFASFDLKRF